MKACVFQKQEPVDIPQIETRALKDVLSLPWGFEIYSLLTRWNPLNLHRTLPRAATGYKVLVAGMGPAGYGVAHNLLNDGMAIGRATQPIAVGDWVRAKRLDPESHTRLPRYVRGHVGRVTHNQGRHVFADAHAAGRGEAPQWLYTVRFDAAALWGEAADPASSVSVDAWQSYLEAP